MRPMMSVAVRALTSLVVVLLSLTTDSTSSSILGRSAVLAVEAFQCSIDRHPKRTTTAHPPAGRCHHATRRRRCMKGRGGDIITPIPTTTGLRCRHHIPLRMWDTSSSDDDRSNDKHQSLPRGDDDVTKKDVIKRLTATAMGLVLLLTCCTTALSASTAAATEEPSTSSPSFFGGKKMDPSSFFSVSRAMPQQQGSSKAIDSRTTIASSSLSPPNKVAAASASKAGLSKTTQPTDNNAMEQKQQEDNKTTTVVPKKGGGLRYWTIMDVGELSLVRQANEALLDHAVGTINTVYYDNSGGINFTPYDMYDKWRALRAYGRDGLIGLEKMKAKDRMMGKKRGYDDVKVEQRFGVGGDGSANGGMPKDVFDSRDGAVKGLKWLTSTLNDPFSKYLTREELRDELLSGGKDGFLGTGAIVEPPQQQWQQQQFVPIPKSSSTSKESRVVASSSSAYARSAAQSARFSSSSQQQTPVQVSTSALPPRTVVPDEILSSSWKKSKLVTTPIYDADDQLLSSSGGRRWTSYQTIKPKSSSSSKNRKSSNEAPSMLSNTRASNLPIITAITPDSPAERAGLVVGDRIVSVGSDKFVGLSKNDVRKTLKKRYDAENYLGKCSVVVAKPVRDYYLVESSSGGGGMEGGGREEVMMRERVVGYRLSKVKLPARSSLEPYRPYAPPSTTTTTAIQREERSSLSLEDIGLPSSSSSPIVSGGDSIVHYELLTPSDSIFEKSLFDNNNYNSQQNNKNNIQSSSNGKVGYIRLTRFSPLATTGYLKAIATLEAAGAQSYIIDIRNNYGGIIQESMLTASTLLRDPHTVLCYTMNARGGFTPHDVEEYVVDKRYPGYLLSSEPTSVTIDQVRKETDSQFLHEDGFMWVPPSSYASLHEQGLKRGMNTRISSSSSSTVSTSSTTLVGLNTLNTKSKYAKIAEQQHRAQKKLVILINEGTASSAEVFASALHDNGRTVALVGAKTYGKGLIQHTIPMPDGGGLRLTVAEYLTPNLQHVTKVGGARYDDKTGEFVGGGIRPDVYCDSKHGIPGNVGADLCVGMALDAIEDAAEVREERVSSVVEPQQKLMETTKSVVGDLFRTDGTDEI